MEIASSNVYWKMCPIYQTCWYLCISQDVSNRFDMLVKLGNEKKSANCGTAKGVSSYPDINLHPDDNMSYPRD